MEAPAFAGVTGRAEVTGRAGVTGGLVIWGVVGETIWVGGR
jgi:hypothetical protein